MKAPHFFGKVCEKHPELEGGRNIRGCCLGCRKAQGAARYAKNKEAMIAEAKTRYADNTERIRDARKVRREELAALTLSERAAKAEARHAKAVKKAAITSARCAKAWRKANAAKVRVEGAIRMAEWRKNNPEITKTKANSPEMRAYRSGRRAATKKATPSWANSFFIKEAYALADLRTKMLGFVWHVDHIVPLKSDRVCGLHWEGNMAVIPGEENSRKGNRRWPQMP